MDYDLFYYPQFTKNVEFVLFDFDPIEGKSVIVEDGFEEGVIVADLTKLQEIAGYDPIELKFS